ncbi:MAG: hypothetical protein HQK63_00050 [Desulfamplus sp.]|nr:hypothetical protein [Desulfamplus sp.]
MIKTNYFFLLVFVSIISVKVNFAETTNSYHGNIQTMTYHRQGCRFYDCQSCTVNLKSQSEAEKAGYRVCQICIVPEKTEFDTPQKNEIPKPEIKTIQAIKPEPPPKPRVPPEPLTVSKAIWNLAENILILLLIEIVIFGLYNCFCSGKIGFLERWNRFQGWLYGKSTSNQLKHALEQLAHEKKQLNQTSGIKKFLFETWYSIRDVFLWLHRFTGCFINFILLTCFTISSWNDTQFILQTWWKWLKNFW